MIKNTSEGVFGKETRRQDKQTEDSNIFIQFLTNLLKLYNTNGHLFYF